MIVVVGPDEGGLGWAQQGDQRAIESDSHMDRSRVVGDDELGAGDDGQELGDGGRADAIGDVGVVFCEFEQWCAAQAFARAADDEDAVDLGAGDEALRQFGEALDRPALARPARSRGNHRVALGVFDDDLRAFIVAGVEAHVGFGDIGTDRFGELEHPIDGVERTRGIDALVEEDPCVFLGIAIADSDRCAGGPGEEPGSGEPLGVDDQIVAGVLELAQPTEQREEASLLALLAEEFAIEGDGVVERGMMGDGFDEGVLDHPVDLGIGEALLERSEHADGSTDIAEGAWSDQQDAFVITHGGYCCLQTGDWPGQCASAG